MRPRPTEMAAHLAPHHGRKACSHRAARSRGPCGKESPGNSGDRSQVKRSSQPLQHGFSSFMCHPCSVLWCTGESPRGVGAGGWNRGSTDRAENTTGRHYRAAHGLPALITAARSTCSERQQLHEPILPPSEQKPAEMCRLQTRHRAPTLRQAGRSCLPTTWGNQSKGLRGKKTGFLLPLLYPQQGACRHSLKEYEL